MIVSKRVVFSICRFLTFPLEYDNCINILIMAYENDDGIIILFKNKCLTKKNGVVISISVPL